MSNDRFDEAAAEVALFWGTETTHEELQIFLEIRFPDLSEEDRKILVEQALAE